MFLFGVSSRFCLEDESSDARGGWYLSTSCSSKATVYYWGGCYDGVMMMFWWYSDDVLMVFWWCCDDVMMMFWWCSDGVTMMFWWCYDDVMMLLWWYAPPFFTSVFEHIVVAPNSRPSDSVPSPTENMLCAIFLGATYLTVPCCGFTSQKTETSAIA